MFTCGSFRCIETMVARLASVPGGPHVASSIPGSCRRFSRLSCRHGDAMHQHFESMKLEALPLSSSGSKLLVEACGSYK